MTEKATFFKFNNKQWIEVDFSDIKKNDIIVKLGLKDVYYTCVKEKHFDENLGSDVIVFDNVEKPEIEFVWNE